MKKLTGIFAAIALVAIVASITLTPSMVKSQKKETSHSQVIPDKVMTIVKTSCMACHSDNGSEMAKGVINFSQWDTYPAKKQSKKAAAISREVTNGTMPPKSYTSKNPGAVLNAEKVKVITDWAATLKSAE